MKLRLLLQWKVRVIAAEMAFVGFCWRKENRSQRNKRYLSKTESYLFCTADKNTLIGDFEVLKVFFVFWLPAAAWSLKDLQPKSIEDVELFICTLNALNVRITL